MSCCTLLFVHSSFAIILIGKRELVAMFSLSSLCLVIIVWLFLTVPWVCLQFVIVVFPDHTHILFFNDFRLFNDNFISDTTENDDNIYIHTMNLSQHTCIMLPLIYKIQVL